MRTHDEQTPHASPSFGVRQFNARAISSAKSFLPMPSSPVNSIAPGSRSETSIRFNMSLTREFPVSSSNIIYREVTPVLQKGNDDLFQTRLRLFDWATRIDQLHAVRLRECDLQVRIAHARVKVGMLDVESIARDPRRTFPRRTSRGAIRRFVDREIEKQRKVWFQTFRR